MFHPRDKSQIETLTRQVKPGRANQVVEAYTDATSKKYWNFLIDLKPETPQQLHYGTDILKDIELVYKLQKVCNCSIGNTIVYQYLCHCLSYCSKNQISSFMFLCLPTDQKQWKLKIFSTVIVF